MCYIVQRGRGTLSCHSESTVIPSRSTWRRCSIMHGNVTTAVGFTAEFIVCTIIDDEHIWQPNASGAYLIFYKKKYMLAMNRSRYWSGHQLDYQNITTLYELRDKDIERVLFFIYHPYSPGVQLTYNARLNCSFTLYYTLHIESQCRTPSSPYKVSGVMAHCETCTAVLEERNSKTLSCAP